MKFYVSVILAIFLPIARTNAESWTLKKGQYYTSYGVYNTLPTSFSNNHFLNFKYSYSAASQTPPFNQQIVGETLSYSIQEKINTAKVAYPFELQFGFKDNLTIFTKMDWGHVHEKFTLSVTNPQNEVEKIFFPTDYYAVESNFGFRKKLFRSNDLVLSAGLAFFPGELRLYKNSSSIKTRTTAVEGSLLYGKNFKQIYFNTLHDNYFECQLTSKYYYQQKHLQFGIALQIGLRPSTDWLVVFGVNSTFAKLNYIKRNIPDIGLFLKDSGIFPSKATRRDMQKFLSTANDGSSPYREAISNSRSHQFNFKTAFFLYQNSSVGLEHSLSISPQAPFTNYTMVLKFEKYF